MPRAASWRATTASPRCEPEMPCRPSTRGAEPAAPGPATATVKQPPATGTASWLWNDVGICRTSGPKEVLVGTTYQVGEFGYLHHLPVCSMEQFGALAVDEQVGLTPCEHNPRDRGGEDEIGTTPRARGAGTAWFERAVESGSGQAVVVRHELGESDLLGMIKGMRLARVTSGDHCSVGLDDHRADR